MKKNIMLTLLATSLFFNNAIGTSCFKVENLERFAKRTVSFKKNDAITLPLVALSGLSSFSSNRFSKAVKSKLAHVFFKNSSELDYNVLVKTESCLDTFGSLGSIYCGLKGLQMGSLLLKSFYNKNKNVEKTLSSSSKFFGDVARSFLGKSLLLSPAMIYFRGLWGKSAFLEYAIDNKKQINLPEIKKITFIGEYPYSQISIAKRFGRCLIKKIRLESDPKKQEELLGYLCDTLLKPVSLGLDYGEPGYMHYGSYDANFLEVIKGIGVEEIPRSLRVIDDSKKNAWTKFISTIGEYSDFIGVSWAFSGGLECLLYLLDKTNDPYPYKNKKELAAKLIFEQVKPERPGTIIEENMFSCSWDWLLEVLSKNKEVFVCYNKKEKTSHLYVKDKKMHLYGGPTLEIRKISDNFKCTDARKALLDKLFGDRVT